MIHELDQRPRVHRDIRLRGFRPRAPAHKAEQHFRRRFNCRCAVPIVGCAGAKNCGRRLQPSASRCPKAVPPFGALGLTKTIVLRAKCSCIGPFAMAKGRPFHGKAPTGRLNSMSGQAARIRMIIAGG
jgi:hypothetical protein